MRDETYYYCDEDCARSVQEASGKLRFAVTELVSLALDNGFVPEGVCNLSSMSIVLNAIRQKDLLPQNCIEKWKNEILAEQVRAREAEKSERGAGFNIGLSPEFRKSNLFFRWLNNIYPIIKTENIHGNEFGADEPYLLTDRSGKAIMLEYLMKTTSKMICDISFDDSEIFETLSDVHKFCGHPYLPDDSAFDLGIWGYPGVGTIITCQAFEDKITDFKQLVEITREALSITLIANEDGSPVKRDVSITEALLEAMFGYYMAWYYVHYAENWMMAYQEAYLNPLYMDEAGCESYDCNLLIDKNMKKYWEEMLHLSKPEEISAIDYNIYKPYITTLPMSPTEVAGFVNKVARYEGLLAIEDYGKLFLNGTYLDFWNWMYEDERYRRDKILAEIAWYAKDDTMEDEKTKLLDAVLKNDCYVAEYFNADHTYSKYRFHSHKPKLKYRERRRKIAVQIEVERNAYLKKLIAKSRSFTKFSVGTESAELFSLNDTMTCQKFLRDIDVVTLCQVFILYYPSQREKVLEMLSVRIRIMVLEGMLNFSKPENFSLGEAVEAEHRIVDIAR